VCVSGDFYFFYHFYCVYCRKLLLWIGIFDGHFSERDFRCVAYNLSRVVVMCGFLYFIGESLYSYGRDSSFLV